MRRSDVNRAPLQNPYVRHDTLKHLAARVTAELILSPAGAMLLHLMQLFVHLVPLAPFSPTLPWLYPLQLVVRGEQS